MRKREYIRRLEAALLNVIEGIEGHYDPGSCCQDERALLRKPCSRCTCGLKERLAVELIPDGYETAALSALFQSLRR